MSAFANILVGGVFHAAVLFLVAAGLQLVFGVQKIVNLACGSFYALGAYFGITFISYATQLGVSPWLIFPGLIVSGILLGFIGPPIERILRSVYGRDESFQLLLTFALVLDVPGRLQILLGCKSTLARQRLPDLRHVCVPATSACRSTICW